MLQQRQGVFNDHVEVGDGRLRFFIVGIIAQHFHNTRRPPGILLNHGHIFEQLLHAQVIFFNFVLQIAARGGNDAQRRVHFMPDTGR